MNLEEAKAKDAALIGFFKATKCPKKVLFIDNHKEIVENVVKACSREKINVTGFWYRAYEKNSRSLTKSEKEQLVAFSEQNNWWLLDHNTEEINRHISSAAKGS
jgi:hypothetical protein